MPACSFCNESFYTCNALITHLKLIHKAQEHSIFFCIEAQCNRNFPSLNSYRKHIRSKHSKSDFAKPLKITSRSSSNQLVNNLKSFFEQDDTDDKSESNDLYLLPDETENHQTSLNNFKNLMLEKKLSFVCKLYSETTLTRKNVQQIIDMITELLRTPLKTFEAVLDTVVLSDQEKWLIKQFLDELKDIFCNFESEHKRFKLLDQWEFFIRPVSYSVGQRMETAGNGNIVMKSNFAQFVPLSKVLKKFFSMPGVLFETLRYMETLKSKSEIENIVQTELWKQHLLHSKDSDIVLPLYIYYDDYETGNPLGSHSGIHKLGAIYSSVACLPPQHQSNLDHIFLVNLFHSSDLKQFGQNMVFGNLVKELNYLKTHGVEVKIFEKFYRIYFSTILVLGDNLGLNSLLGFQECFTSNHFCRFCKKTRADTQLLTSEDRLSLRNKHNYLEDLRINYAYQTGIKSFSILNNIKGFHVTQNYAVDIAHDIFEGVGPIVMANLLYQFIYVDKYFNLDMLNDRIKFFNYSSNDNKPPLLSAENLKKQCIRMSASEMKTFLLSAGLIIGDLIPHNNEFWEIFIYLRKILQIILRKSIDLKMIFNLDNYIQKHHALFLKKYVKLKPKFHFMTHYPSILKKIGPIANIMTLRYESKHRLSKLSADVVASRVNITRTLSIKHQLKLASIFSDNVGFSDHLYYKKTEKKSIYAFLPDFEEVIKFSDYLYHENLDEFEAEAMCVDKFRLRSKSFAKSDIILLDNNLTPVFGEISKILVSSNNHILVLYKKIITGVFSKQLCSHSITITDDRYLVFLHDLATIDTYAINTKGDIKYISI